MVNKLSRLVGPRSTQVVVVSFDFFSSVDIGRQQLMLFQLPQRRVSLLYAGFTKLLTICSSLSCRLPLTSVGAACCLSIHHQAAHSCQQQLVVTAAARSHPAGPAGTRATCQMRKTPLMTCCCGATQLGSAC